LRAKSRCSLLIWGNRHLLVLLTRRPRPVLLLLMCHLSSSVDRSIVQQLLLILLMLRWSQWVGEVICVCCPAYPSVKFKLAHGLLDLLWTKHQHVSRVLHQVLLLMMLRSTVLLGLTVLQTPSGVSRCRNLGRDLRRHDHP
jgi:hypothetical protein